MTPLRKSTHSNRIVRLGAKPPVRPGNTPADDRCPILGNPNKWLEEYNKQFKTT